MDACDLPWIEFRWPGPSSPSAPGSAHSALLVPVELDGVEIWVQLDTGSDVSELYGRKVAQYVEAKVHGHTARVGQMRFGRFQVGKRKWGILDHGSDGDAVPAGTIGADLLQGAVLVVDFPRTRLAVLTSAEGDALPGAAQRVAARVVNTKLYVPVEVGGQPVENVFWDSGSSQFGLDVDRSLWTRLTGLTEPAADGPAITGTQWGRPKRWPGALLPDLVVAGRQTGGSPVAYFDEADPATYSTWRVPTQGSP